MAHLALYKLNLLDRFEDRRDYWNFADFEECLLKAWRGTIREDAVGLIHIAHKERCWPKTVKRYLLTHYKAFGKVSAELHQVFAEVVAFMSAKERAHWGI